MPCGRGFKKADRLSRILISHGKYLKSLQVKCVWIHIGRNYIRPLTEKSFIVARDMHVGFKVQLVVEFYIYPLCLDHSQTQKIAITPEQAHLKMSRPLPRLAVMSLCLEKAVPVCGSHPCGSNRLPSSVPVSSCLRSPFCIMGSSSLKVAQRWGSKNCFDYNGSL